MFSFADAGDLTEQRIARFVSPPRITAVSNSILTLRHHAMKSLTTIAVIALFASLTVALATFYQRAKRAEEASGVAATELKSLRQSVAAAASKNLAEPERSLMPTKAAPPPTRYLDRLLQGERPRPTAVSAGVQSSELFPQEPNLRRLMATPSR